MEYQENQESIQAWAEDAFGEPANVMRLVVRANMEMAELLREAQGSDPFVIALEAADVLILLYRVVEACKFDLHRMVDEKMKINRKRKWIKAGDGTGYHTREQPDA